MAQSLDSPQSQLDATVKIFDSFYDFDISVNASVYEIINSYFISVCASPSVAKNFTTMLFRIADITGESPLVLLDNISGKTKLETTALMAYYLNSIKSKTTLYGVSVTPIPNENVQRNVVI